MGSCLLLGLGPGTEEGMAVPSGAKGVSAAETVSGRFLSKRGPGRLPAIHSEVCSTVSRWPVVGSLAQTWSSVLPDLHSSLILTQPSPSPNLLRCPLGSVREAWGSLCNRLFILLGRPVGTMNSYVNLSGAKAVIPVVLSQGLGRMCSDR